MREGPRDPRGSGAKGEPTPRRGIVFGLALVFAAVVAILWLPRWWENRLYRQAEKIAGVGSPVLAGSVTQARQKVHPGMLSDGVLAAIGRPSLSVGTQGSSSHDIWTYYYADGTITVNLTDGVIQRISLAYGPPKIPASHRP